MMDGSPLHTVPLLVLDGRGILSGFPRVERAGETSFIVRGGGGGGGGGGSAMDYYHLLACHGPIHQDFPICQYMAQD